MRNLYLFIILFIALNAHAQVAVNTDGTAPDNSAMLDVKSTTRGFLAPRMTLAQRNAILNPASGLVVFQTNSSPGLYINSGTPAAPSWNLVGTNSGQWLNNGTSIYYNSGNVGIGTNAPAAPFHVANSSSGNAALFGSNIFGFPGTTSVSIGYDTGESLLYVGQSDNNKGYLIWNYNPDPALANFYIGTYSGSNPLILQPYNGKVGIGNGIPSGMLHVAKVSGTPTGIFGTPLSNFNSVTNLSVGDDAGTALLYVGQSEFYKGFLKWNYDPTPANAQFWIGSYNGSNPLIIQPEGGNVGIGTITPVSRLHVELDDNGLTFSGYSNIYTNYFYHAEVPVNGYGQTNLYSFRTRTSQNDGAGYAYNLSNSATKGFSFWGDLYSFGLSGFNYNDYTRCGGILGAEQGGFYWGSLGYRNSGSTSYGGYFTSYTIGGGKSSQADIGIGIGAWGDLMGADIHGKVYGIYAEGGNYAMYSNGVVFKNNLDVHLQENGTETNTVLYTNVSTDVTVQTSGYATLSDGKVSIDFDPAFAAAVSTETPVVVTVTPTGSSNGVYLAEVSGKGFKVAENNDGKSSVTISYIAIGKRAGYENPSLPREVISAGYNQNLARGLHNDADTHTNGEGLYYENGNLVVGKHASTLPDPNKPSEESVRPKPGVAAVNTQNSGSVDTPSGSRGQKGSTQNVPQVKKAIEDLSKPSAAGNPLPVKASGAVNSSSAGQSN
ncbi:MAG: hypothetical protein FD166_3235 [Bacteroidetes bacterium]|nr:MAG: hypothetical protein FD166_3235 [Bacteroidota bacterium]